MKICSTCKEGKPFSEFYRNRTAKDGYNNVCKKCAYEYQKDWKERNIEKVRADGRRNKAAQREREGEEATKQKWNDWYEKNKEHRRAYQRARQDKRKSYAHNALQYALRKERIIRPEHCSSCDKECKPDAHHPDYDKPLEVIWLCRSCHRLLQNK